MKLFSYRRGQEERTGILIDNKGYDLSDSAIRTGQSVPSAMAALLLLEEKGMDACRETERFLKQDKTGGFEINQQLLLAPVPHPTSCRDGYAFRQHVEAARRNRKVPMIPEFDQYPIFYFTNHNAVQGPGPVVCMPDHFHKLDFELEVSIVIGKRGRNIHASEADKYIAGYMIMNDMSARTLQMEEMVLNLGPAKGKDFSTVIGPWLVTPDELESLRVAAKPGHTGNNYDLPMICRVNGIEVSRGNMKDMDWTFAEIIERCAYGVDIFPGDVIGSGTVGTGCFLELNGTGLLNDPAYKVQWLKEGDIVEMEMGVLGTLNNTIVKDKSDFSLLELKKVPQQA